MAEIAATGASGVLDDFSITNKTQDEVADNQALGQEEFLSLMTTQLQNQDPLAPMENGDFIAQLAQFGTVSGIGELQVSVDALSSAMTATDATDAASLVGKTVLTEGSSGYLAEGGELNGAIEIPEGVSNVQIRIESGGGTLIDTIELANQSTGLASFQWDGKNASGDNVAAGNYVIKATGAGQQGPESLNTLIGNRVDSVSMGNASGGIVLNLAGAGSKPLSEVTQIGL